VIDVNPGRPPTPIGGDGIDPWIRVEDWQGALIVEMLQTRGISHRVRREGGRVVDGCEVPLDRISFPGGDARQLQTLFHAWLPKME